MTDSTVATFKASLRGGLIAPETRATTRPARSTTG